MLTLQPVRITIVEFQPLAEAEAEERAGQEMAGSGSARQVGQAGQSRQVGQVKQAAPLAGACNPYSGIPVETLGRLAADCELRAAQERAGGWSVMAEGLEQQARNYREAQEWELAREAREQRRGGATPAEEWKLLGLVATLLLGLVGLGKLAIWVAHFWVGGVQ
jgi:hypothetical protein